MTVFIHISDIYDNDFKKITFETTLWAVEAG